MDWLCFTKPIYCDRSTLLCKAHPSWWICFASQSLSIMMDGLCFAKPFQWWIGFASQSQSILIGLLCFAKPIHCGGLEWLCFAKPFHWVILCPAVFGFRSRLRGYSRLLCFSRFSPVGGWVVRIKGLWCPPGVPLRSFPTGGRYLDIVPHHSLNHQYSKNS